MGTSVNISNISDKEDDQLPIESVARIMREVIYHSDRDCDKDDVEPKSDLWLELGIDTEE